MAAEAFISSLVSTVLGNLNSLAFQELGVIGGLKTELENLKSTLTTVQAVIRDAEEWQWKSEAVKNWLEKLKDVAYDADDVLDEFAAQAQRRRRQKGFRDRVRSFLSLDQNPIVFRVQMSHRVKNVRERFDAIAEERIKFHFKETVDDVRGDNLDWRQTSSLINESEVYGRDTEKDELIDGLLTSSTDLSVYAICGMGGVGKTTLAQLVYNDHRIKMHFEFRIWVCVSVHSELRRLIRAIIESIEDSPCGIQELDPLQRQLQEKLSGRRFLLVLDDIWDHDFDKWSRLNDALRFGAKGSVVMMTTRIETIALQLATVSVHNIGRLSEEDSWSLFKRRAFGTQNEEMFMHLEEIGKAIVKKCGGVPLAIKALGSLMQLKSKEDEWLSIREKMVWDLLGEESTVTRALRLSYDHLPSDMKQCFVFCSVFPKDHAMRKDRLIQLWMANGFISCQNQIDLHNRGNDIFNELVWRSFFQDVEEKRPGVITCKMHDLVHDLAKSIMIHECCFVLPDEGLQGVPEKVRHLAVYEGFRRTASWNVSFKGLVLRSLLIHCEEDSTGYPNPYFYNQKHLRAICCVVQKLPKSIGKLKHLRYMDFSYSRIKTLPESICSLQNLQTLILSNCDKLHLLPKGMKHMSNLIYLDITNCSSLLCMPDGMGGLTGLRKLSMFIVGREDGQRIGELKMLNLEEELSIKDLQNVKDFINAKSANLMMKKNLVSLRLFWQKDSINNPAENVQEVLGGLQPHPNLKKLVVSEYRGFKFSNWIMELLLPNLLEISLENCDNCERLPPFGKLQFLKDLRLIGMKALKYVDDDLYGNGEVSFPSLERMILDSMSSLKEWVIPAGRTVFPRLWKLTVSGCPNLDELPLIPSVKRLQIGASSVTLLNSLRHFSSLTSLCVFDFPDMSIFPDGLMQNHKLLEYLQIFDMKKLKSLHNQLDNLSALKCLEIQWCYELECLPDGLQNLNSLETLVILSCKGLHSLPTAGFRGLSSLRTLSIEYCDELTSLSDGLQYLTGLRDLLVIGCPNLNSLPESIRHLAALRSLTLIFCQGLSYLPDGMGCLTSLSHLDIRWCSKLMSLPEGMQNLMELKELTIEECRHLERRCKMNGKDWSKIAHIPCIYINDKPIQTSTSHR